MPTRSGAAPRKTMRSTVRTVALALHLTLCECVTFKLDPSHERCISETIPVRSLLTGDWRSKPLGPASSTDQTNAQVRAPNGDVLFEKKDPLGHFSVTAKTAGDHHICVRNEGTTAHEVSLTVKQAVEVEDHNLVAKQEHIEAIEAELDRMKKMATHVYEEMQTMRARSELMQSTDASTRGRLLWVEVSMLCKLQVTGYIKVSILRTTCIYLQLAACNG